ncbi:hypothetical protein AN9479.2 [Aspergillus nidulans FGSC A4]|nr:hypothetical protein AN9479.2 [Aspergillus nidulans FGSC A4]|eukprot:XP_868861.1 hypothetical protein AN9479.2 [Aspergillus nidulans FGSC A4]
MHLIAMHDTVGSGDSENYVMANPMQTPPAILSNFLILMQIGAKHVETPFIEFGQISTIIYFAYFFN